jgi:hypothetical protein
MWSIRDSQICDSVKGLKESADALRLYEDFTTQKVPRETQPARSAREGGWSPSFASCQDYYGIKQSLRVPPMSEIRKDCRQIIRGSRGARRTGR